MSSRVARGARGSAPVTTARRGHRQAASASSAGRRLHPPRPPSPPRAALWGPQRHRVHVRRLTAEGGGGGACAAARGRQRRGQRGPRVPSPDRLAHAPRGFARLRLPAAVPPRAGGRRALLLPPTVPSAASASAEHPQDGADTDNDAGDPLAHDLSSAAAAAAADTSGAYRASLAAALATLHESIDRGEGVYLARALRGTRRCSASPPSRRSSTRAPPRCGACSAPRPSLLVTQRPRMRATSSSDDDGDLQSAARAGGIAAVEEELARSTQALAEAQVRREIRRAME